MISPPAYFDRSCYGCGKFGHTIETCWRNVTCQWCGRYGHIAAVCFQLRRSFGQRQQTRYTRKKKRKVSQNWKVDRRSSNSSEECDSGHDSDWSYKSESDSDCNRSVHSWVQKQQRSKVASKVGTVFPDWQEQRQKQLCHSNFVESWMKPTVLQVGAALKAYAIHALHESTDDEEVKSDEQEETPEQSSSDEEMPNERIYVETTEAIQPEFIFVEDHNENDLIMSSYLPRRLSITVARPSKMKWRNVLGKYNGPLLV